MRFSCWGVYVEGGCKRSSTEGRFVRTTVANKVYATTHHGLTQLVSGRVASQVLDNALRGASCSAETVNVQEMGRVLKGPVLRDLAMILPRAGLELSLKKLFKTLQTLSDETGQVKPQEKPPAALPADGAVSGLSTLDAPTPEVSSQDVSSSDAPVLGLTAGRRPTPEPYAHVGPSALSVAEPRVEAPVAGAQVLEAGVLGAEVLGAEVLGAGVLEAGVLEVTAPPAPPSLGPAARDDLLLAFAQLEHVEMVAAFEGGGVTAVRGSGFEVEALSRLGTLGLRLLGRSGELRTFYVAHSRGQLFLFPFGEVTLMLIGSSELNLGVVFATLHKFKEEL